jgi:hypothetical protein
MSVVMSNGFASSLDELTLGLTSDMEALGGAVLSASTVSVSGQNSYRVELGWPLNTSNGSTMTIRVGSLSIPRGENSVLVSVGCADDDACAAMIDDVLSSVRAAPEATPTKTARVEAAGISLQYPADWTVMPRTKKELAAQKKQLARSNPDFAQLLVDRAQLEIQPDTVKFRAVDLAGAFNTGTGAGNVRVYVHAQSRFPRSLDEFVAGFKLATDATGGRVVNAEVVAVSGERAYRADIAMPAKTTADGSTTPAFRVHRLLLARGRGDVRVDVTTADEERSEELVDAILGSVRRTPRHS